MKKLVVLATVAAMLANGSMAFAASNSLEKIKEEGVLQVCMEPYFAPYEFCDTSKQGQEQYCGADVELAKYIANELGVELEIVPLEFSAVIASVVSGKYPMAISGLGYTPERAEAVEMSDSYRTTDAKHGFVFRKDNVDDYSCLADLNGTTIAYQNGSLQDMYVHDQVENFTAKPFDGVNQAILALQSGKADAVAVNYENGQLFVEANEDLAMGSFLFEDTKDTTCIAITKGETELLEEMNRIIADVVEQGLFTEWWDAATEQANALGLD